MQACAKMRVNNINKQLALCRNELRELRKLGVHYVGSQFDGSDDGETTDDSFDAEDYLEELEDYPINEQTLRECMSLRYIIENRTDTRNITRRKTLSQYILDLIDTLGLDESEVTKLENESKEFTAFDRQ